MQSIKNEFMVEVYETNARIALEFQDIGQFNQCQTQLRHLHNKKGLTINKDTRLEFMSYRVIYNQIQGLRHDVQRFLAETTREERSSTWLKWALKVRESAQLNNFSVLLHLYEKAPGDGKYGKLLLNFFLKKVRAMYLLVLCKGHQTLSLDTVQKLLNIKDDKEFLEFLGACNAVLTAKDKKKLDCKKTHTAVAECSILKKQTQKRF